MTYIAINIPPTRLPYSKRASANCSRDGFWRSQA